ncbi:MAG: NTP transferase domain-containing protein [Chloroflexota bacterium]
MPSRGREGIATSRRSQTSRGPAWTVGPHIANCLRTPFSSRRPRRAESLDRLPATHILLRAAISELPVAGTLNRNVRGTPAQPQQYANVPLVDESLRVAARTNGEPAIPQPRHHRENAFAHQAVILAAGEGSRLRESRTSKPKPLTEVGGLTLLERAVRNCRDTDASDIVVVLGYQADAIKVQLPTLSKRYDIRIRTAISHDWHLGNGTSVLAAAAYINEPFLLVMCDHLVHPDLLVKLLEADDGARTCALAVDCQPALVRDAAEATKIAFDGPRIAAIGKSLLAYDAIDTGVFLCRGKLFDALREAAASGHHSLSEAVQLLAAVGEVAWVSSGGQPWVDVDTPDDLRYVRSLFASGAWSDMDGAIEAVEVSL